MLEARHHSGVEEDVGIRELGAGGDIAASRD
jgi:hypothetical protein